MAFKVGSYLGFGDHCSVFGIIKEWAKYHDKIEYYSGLPREKHTRENAIRLYSSIPNVEIMDQPILWDKVLVDYSISNTYEWDLKVQPWDENPDLPLGDNFGDNPEEWRCEQQWYKNAGVPFNKKWDNFYLKRNLDKEKEIYYDILGLKDGEEFVFLHEDTTRGFEYSSEGYKINRKYVNTNIKTIELMNIQHISILDLTYTFERAKEIHSFNSGIAIFVDLILKTHDALFYHDYVRRKIFWRPTFKLNWKEIKNER